MKKPTHNLAAIRPKIFSPRWIMPLLIFLLLTNWANAQPAKDSPAAKELYDRIASLDAALFAAYTVTKAFTVTEVRSVSARRGGARR